MGEARTEAVLKMAGDLGTAAAALMDALDATIAEGGMRAREAQRHLVRLRFSLARVDELKVRVALDRGVFEPARLEVAISILDTYVLRAEDFCRQAATRTPTPAVRPMTVRVADDGSGAAAEAQKAA